MSVNVAYINHIILLAHTRKGELNMIIATVTGQTLNLEYSEVISDSSRFLTVKFNFDSDWDDTLKTVVFKHNSNEYDVVLQDGNSMYLGDNICFVPQEVIKTSGFLISVYGVKDYRVITSSAQSVAVIESGCGDLIPVDPTPTLWVQMLEISRRAYDMASSVKEKSDSGELNGKGVPIGGGRGQVLAKNSYLNYDTVWTNLPEFYTKEEAFAKFVPKTFTINGIPLTHNFYLTCEDIGAYEYDEDMGIPRYDLSASVRSSLAKADTALQTVDLEYSAQSQNPQSGTAVCEAISGKQDKFKVVNIQNESVLLEDNAVFVGTNISTLTVTSPQGNFDCLIKITTASSGNINITLPVSAYIGAPPVFSNGETWEISISNGIAVAGKAEQV